MRTHASPPQDLRKGLRGKVPFRLKVRMETRKRRMGMDAEDRIVIHTKDGQIVRHTYAAARTDPQDGIGAMVV